MPSLMGPNGNHSVILDLVSFLKSMNLTDGSCCETLDDSLGWIAAWIERGRCIFCKAEANDCK